MTAPTSTTTAPAVEHCRPWCVRHDIEGCLSDWLPTLPALADVRAKSDGTHHDIWLTVADDDFLSIEEARALAAAITAACDLAETGTSTLDPIPGSDAIHVRLHPVPDRSTSPRPYMPGTIHAQALGYRDLDHWASSQD
jgi:hypothetical protein